jgi:hypothetical protein
VERAGKHEEKITVVTLCAMLIAFCLPLIAAAGYLKLELVGFVVFTLGTGRELFRRSLNSRLR